MGSLHHLEGTLYWLEDIRQLVGSLELDMVGNHPVEDIRCSVEGIQWAVGDILVAVEGTLDADTAVC